MIVLSLTLCELTEYEGKRVVLFREVDWPSVPPENSWLQFGLTEDGPSGNSATIQRVCWEASGSANVEASASQLRDEYDDTVEDAKRDGFLEYEQWSGGR